MGLFFVYNLQKLIQYIEWIRNFDRKNHVFFLKTIYTHLVRNSIIYVAGMSAKFRIKGVPLLWYLYTTREALFISLRKRGVVREPIRMETKKKRKG